MRTPIIVVAAAITIAACRDSAGTSDAITVRDSSGVAIVENDLLRLDASCVLAPTPTVSIGEEEGPPEYEFERIAGVRRLSDGRFVLADQSASAVRWYGADGRHIRSTGRQGNGPGEFTNIFTLHSLSGDIVYAGNDGPFQFVVFDANGNLVRTVQPTPMMINSADAIGILDDGRMMLVVSDLRRGLGVPGQFALQMRAVQLHAADGRLIDTVTTMPHGRYGRMLGTSNFFTMPLFESYSHATARDTIIVLGHGAERELRVYTAGAETRLARLIRWTGESREVTSADIDADRAREKAAFDTMEPRFRSFWEQAYETNVHPQRPIADVMPAMNGIRLGTDGRIWIREYQPPVDTSARRWVAFTREGRFDCRLSAPKYQDFLEFGADYLLVVDADSLGVERVKQFGVSRR